MEADALLSLRGVSVRRGAAEVLHDLSLDVTAGQVTALLGSNGAGKSTTLRTISGLHRPSAGQITLDGHRIDHLDSRAIVRLGVVHVPEGRLIFPALTVRENLEMGGFVHGKLGRDELSLATDIFPALGPLMSRRGGALSGGQQQMLAIARGLLTRPKVLLLDEPSLGLAPIIVHAISEALEGLCREGLTVLLVEQNAGVALRLANRGYVIANGRIAFSGTAEELQGSDEVRRAYLGI